MAKIINLKSSEDITSAVEQLWETSSSEVYFVIPKSSTLLKNAVALKLLKREADRLEKAIVLITKDEVGREMAKRVGLAARVALPKKVEDFGEQTEEDEAIATKEAEKEDVLKEMSPKKYESFIEEEVKLKRELNIHSHSRGMSDIRPKPAMEKKRDEQILTQKIEVTDETDQEREIPVSYQEHQEYDELNNFLTPDNEAEKFVIPTSEKEEAIADFVEKRPPREEIEIRKKEKIKDRSSFFSFRFLSFFVGGAVLVAAAVLYFVLPKADIVLVPKSQALENEFLVSASKSITKVDVSSAKIPAQLIKLDEKESKDFPATGQRQLNDKATGTITIYNEYSSAPQSLVAQTRFVSDSGKVFRLTKSAVVPGAIIDNGKIVASSIDAQVVADQVGPDYNIGPTNFKIPGFQGSPKYDSFYASSKTAMSGGAVGLAKVVSQDDYDKAKVDIWQSLQPKIEQELKAQAPANLKILDQAIEEEIASIESSVPVGSQADNFTLTVKGSGTLLLFDENDIMSLAADKIKNDLGSDKQVDEKSNQISYSETSADFTNGLLSFRAQVTQKMVWNVDIDGLKQLIAGKNETQIRQVFAERTEIDKARILFWPFWVKTVPENLDKIDIKISSE